MAVTLNASVSFTLNLGNYQSARYEMGVAGVDPALPIEPQIAQAVGTFPVVAAGLEQAILAQLRENDIIIAVRQRG